MRNPARRRHHARLRGAQRPRGGTLCRWRPLILTNRARHQYLGAGRATAAIYGQREYVTGRSDVLSPSRTCSGAPPTMSTKFCAGRSCHIPIEQPTKFDLIDRSYHRQGARPRCRHAARPCRRGDREPISKSFEEDDEAGKLDKAEEIVGVVLPANEDPTLPLNPGEEALDEPASHVAA